MFPQTVMFVYLASDSIVQRLLIPDIVLALSEWFAVEKLVGILVHMADMIAYADVCRKSTTGAGSGKPRVPGASLR
ncbi:MAG: hypothetical protein VYA69_08680 [Gemmatimonadota bacterium]|nr:hypothetical protein [Gemmatimonadota bacterium]